jgi:hypothetical protein
MKKLINTFFKLFPKNFLSWSELVYVVLALLLFTFLAGYKIGKPGLYYDELLFVNGALGGKIDMFVHSRVGNLPLMLMPYIGALKAWIFYPIFKIFGVTPESIRWPVVAIGTLTLWINYRFIKMTFSRSAALIFLLLAAVEPSTLFHTRLDWGPTVLMMFFRSLLLFFIFVWIKTKKSWVLIVIGIVGLLGIFDKLNFVWFISAAVISLVMVYPKRFISYAKYHWRGSLVLAVLGLMSVIGFFLYTNYNLPLGKELGSLDWVLRWQQVVALLQLTISGVGVYSVVVGNELSIASRQLIVLVVATITGLIVLIPTRKAKVEWRALGFIIIFSFLTLAQMFLTNKATGPHHAAMFAPLWLIPISVLLGQVFNPTLHRLLFLKWSVLVLVLVVVISSLSIDLSYLKSFDGPIQPRWDAGSYNLAKVIKENSERPVICVDWGTGTIIYGLLNGNVNLYDYWPTFSNGLSTIDAEYYEENLLPQNPIFVVPVEGKETFSATRKHFFEIAVERNWKLVKFAQIEGQNGDLLFELYSIIFNPIELDSF